MQNNSIIPCLSIDISYRLSRIAEAKKYCVI